MIENIVFQFSLTLSMGLFYIMRLVYTNEERFHMAMKKKKKSDGRILHISKPVRFHKEYDFHYLQTYAEQWTSPIAATRS